MDTQKITVKASLLTLILALMVTFTIAAVMKNGNDQKNVVVPKKFTTTTFYYNGPATATESELKDHNNWDEVQDNGLSCGTALPIPCSMEVPDEKTVSEYLTQLGTEKNILNASQKGRTP